MRQFVHLNYIYHSADPGDSLGGNQDGTKFLVGKNQ